MAQPSSHPHPAPARPAAICSGRAFAYRSFWPRDEDLADAAARGIDTVCLYPSNTHNSLGIPYSDHPPHWLHQGAYDWPALDRQFEQVIAANPRARILCMIDLNAPLWLVRYHFLDDPFLNLGRVSHHEKWRAETVRYLRDFLTHVEARYGDRIDAYMLSCGNTCEWQDHSQGSESVSRRAAWRSWSIARGHGDPVDIPAASVRDHVSHDLLRDPQADALALRYGDFCRWQIGDTILHCAAEAQTILHHRVPLGMFYGYVLEHGVGTLINLGHLDFDRVFACEDLDFFTAPGTYGDRQIGGASGFMQPTRGLIARGKGFLHEIDHCTHTANTNPLGRLFGVEWGTFHKTDWSDEARSAAGLKREFALSLLNGASLWWFDMWNGWYAAPAIRDLIAHMKGIWDEHAGRIATGAQIAVVVDSESALYLDQHDPRVQDIYYRLRAALGRIGAPYDIISLADLGHLDLAPYRLVVFPALYAVDAGVRDRLDRHVLKDGRTVLWRDRPGVIADGRYDEAGVEALTGIPYAARSGTRAMPGWTSVLEPLAPWTTARLREVARQAGVHLYGETEEPVYAAEGFLAAHSASGGARTYRLPRRVARVRELFTGALVAEDVDAFTDTLAAPDTRLYRLEG